MLRYMSQHPQELQLQWDDLALIGARLPNLEQVLENRETQWQTVTLNRWYGEAARGCGNLYRNCCLVPHWFTSCANPLGTGT